MFFLNDLMPLAKSPIRVLILLLPPNRSRTTASTISQCQMLKLPMTTFSCRSDRGNNHPIDMAPTARPCKR